VQIFTSISTIEILISTTVRFHLDLIALTPITWL